MKVRLRRAVQSHASRHVEYSANGDGASVAGPPTATGVVAMCSKRMQPRPVRPRSSWLGLWLCLAGAAGCGGDGTPQASPLTSPLAGLFTPGSKLGASDKTDLPDQASDLGERCGAPDDAMDAGMPTVGTLSIAYTTLSLDGRYAPKNCTAVWIETEAGQYVATLELMARLRIPGLVYYEERGCLAKPGPDVVTGATLRDHGMDHMLTWSGTDLAGRVMPDGAYRLMIEVTETDKQPGELYEFPFDKTAVSFERELGVDGALQNLSLSWVVEAGVVDDERDLDAGD